jgi:ABC-type multidrug transport system permease subunit
MLQNIAIYPNERDVFYREEADNCYSAESFMVQYTTLEIPFEIVSSLIFGVLAAYADNLKRSPQMFLICAYNCFCIISCGESVGIMFCTLFSHVGFAVNVTSILLSISTILGGVMSLNVNDVLQGINHVSPIKYAIGNLAPYSLKHQRFFCTRSQQLADGSCPITSGQQVLELYNLDTNAPINIMALGVVTIAYRLVAYVLLKVIRSQEFLDRARDLRARFKASRFKRP